MYMGEIGITFLSFCNRWSSLIEIHSRPAWQGHICSQPHSLIHSFKHAHIYCVITRERHTRLSRMGLVSLMFSQKRWYMVLCKFSLLGHLILWAWPFTFLPIHSHLMEYKSPPNQSWPAAYQHSYDVSAVWYAGWLSVPITHTYT